MDVPQSELVFSFSKSSGPGGQNVNKVNTKVTLTWDYLSSKIMSSAQKERFNQKYSGFITKEKLIKITSQRYRNQSRNINDCIEKLNNMLLSIAKPKKSRIGTKPTKSSIERRIKTKKGKSDIKKNRQKVKH